MHLSERFLQLSLSKAEFKFFNNKSQLPVKKFFEKNEIEEFSIDSRTIKKNHLFVALKGEKIDAHQFLEDVLKIGVQICIINKKKEDLLNLIDKKLLQEKLFILVDDTLSALKNLAKNWRRQFNYPIVGITGSIGKTTTKGMFESIVKSARYSAYVSYLNQNTVIGLSLNILKLSNKYKVGVFELGIDSAGEMDQLVDILKPDIALITCISHSHMLGLGGLNNIAKEKRKIFKYFKPDNFGIIFGDQEILDRFSRNFPMIKFGLKTKNQIQARKIKIISGDSDNYEFKIQFVLKVYKAKKTVYLQGNNLGFVKNALAASAVANLLNIDIDNIVKGLEKFSSIKNRFEKRTLKNYQGIVISDCYNANPESMKVALNALGRVETKNIKIAILGDMLELGSRTTFWHKNIGRFLHKVGDIDYLILVGKAAQQISKTSPLNFKTNCVENWQQAQKHLENILKYNKNNKAIVLVKASRGVLLDRLIKEISV
ncbi:UDP-N-acetylmuramoyl-tripeptide--D-alanyl-D-alanine ligase [Candidatus Dependentiae bacterium]|nr:UDP-N-acetylmuramoyl-tripeptide--D-alanyl-D-alanine ligase [Candidatus Dependentiae bacterium]